MLFCHTSCLVPHVNMVFLCISYHLVVIEATVIIYIYGKEVSMTITIHIHKSELMTIDSTFLYRHHLIITHIIVGCFIPCHRRLLRFFHHWFLYRLFHHNHLLGWLLGYRLCLILRGNISTVYHIFCCQRSTLLTLGWLSCCVCCTTSHSCTTNKDSSTCCNSLRYIALLNCHVLIIVNVFSCVSLNCIHNFIY